MISRPLSSVQFLLEPISSCTRSKRSVPGCGSVSGVLCLMMDAPESDPPPIASSRSFHGHALAVSSKVLARYKRTSPNANRSAESSKPKLGRPCGGPSQGGEKRMSFAALSMRPPPRLAPGVLHLPPVSLQRFCLSTSYSARARQENGRRCDQGASAPAARCIFAPAG